MTNLVRGLDLRGVSLQGTRCSAYVPLHPRLLHPKSKAKGRQRFIPLSLIGNCPGGCSCYLDHISSVLEALSMGRYQDRFKIKFRSHD